MTKTSRYRIQQPRQGIGGRGERMREDNALKGTTVATRITHGTPAKWFFFCIIVVMSIPSLTWAQYDNFDAATVPCPSDSSIIGYDNLAAVNSDMNRELEFISGGAPPQENGYFVILCPETTFQAEGNTLRPVLDQLTISCGPTGANQNCILTGGNQHVQILDSEVAGYTLNSINIAGLTFTQMSGTAFSARASAPTQVTLMNCIWQDFDTSQLFVLRADNPMTVNVEMSTIRSTPAFETGATANFVFRNEGGVVVTNGLSIEDVNIGEILQVEQNGAGFLTDTTITGSTINSVVSMDSGVVDIEGMNIENNQQLRDVFLIENAGAEISMNNTVVANNQQDSSFTILDVSGGASATMTNSVIENNGQLQNAVIINSNSNGMITDTDFIGNTATDSTPLVVSFESGANLDMARVEFIGNTNGLANLGGMFGGDISFRQMCFRENNNLIVVLVLEGSNFEAENNFVDNESEISILCGGRDEVEGPNRLSVEIAGSRCFNGGSECLVTCEEQTNDVDRCMANEILSMEPSMLPSISPQPTDIPSAAPSDSPDPGCEDPNNPCVTQNRVCADGELGGVVCGDCLSPSFVELGNGVCQDVDECLEDTLNDCLLANRTCVNTVGSFECQDCLPGFSEGNGAECIDDNECVLFPNNACTATNRECVNTLGGFECGECLPLFIEEDGACVPEDPGDPCLEPANECDLVFRVCQSTDGVVACGDCVPPRVEDENSVCQIVDPCENPATDTCATEFRVCSSTNGAIQCLDCIVGFEENVSGVCEPINPCLDPATDACAPEFRVCSFANGVVECLGCIEGFEENDAGVCVATNPCFDPNTNRCDAEFRVCSFASGAIECLDCIDGFEESEAGICEQINPCSDPTTDTCAPEFRICSFDSGVLQCLDCIEGYEEINLVCQPIDPCLEPGNDCDILFRTCSSESGSITCGDCLAPVYEENSLGLCQLAQPCADPSNICSQEFRECDSNNGVISCGPCLPGYIEENNVCSAQQPCLDAGNSCTLANRLCIPGAGGSFSCGDCLPSFAPDESGICVATNACQDVVSQSFCFEQNRICENLADGGFQCGECLLNHELDSDGNCIPLDACQDEENSNLCLLQYRECEGLPNGEFRCGPCLSPAFQLGDDGETCVDVNECLNPLNDCALQSRYCFNQFGSFECAGCVEGYQNIAGRCVPGSPPTPVPTIEQINRPTPLATPRPTRTSSGLWPLPFDFDLFPTIIFPPPSRPRPPPVVPPSSRPPPRPTPRPPHGRPPVYVPPVYYPPYPGKGGGKGSKTGGSYKDKDYNKIFIGKGKGKGGSKGGDESGDYHFGIGYVQPRIPVDRQQHEGTKWYGRRFGGDEADS